MTAFLPLDELKTAIEHDVARRWPEAQPLPDFPAARRLVLDAILELERMGLEPVITPSPVPTMLERIDRALAKLGAAQRVLLAATPTAAVQDSE